MLIGIYLETHKNQWQLLTIMENATPEKIQAEMKRQQGYYPGHMEWVQFPDDYGHWMIERIIRGDLPTFDLKTCDTGHLSAEVKLIDNLDGTRSILCHKCYIQMCEDTWNRS